jgi:pimeloyl-ACP methyl ester carboxylesterase
LAFAFIILFMAAKKIIALHGAGMGPEAWNALDAHLPLHALALPGHGDGARPLTSIAGMARWVEKQITDAEGIILLGHSMGALVALEAGGHRAVESLVLLGAAARMPVHADLLKTARENPAEAANLIKKWGVFDRNREVFGGQMGAMGALFDDLSACNNYQKDKFDFTKPAFVLAAAGDKMVRPADSEALARLLKGEYAVLPAAGHMMMLEKPSETAVAIRKFLC